MNSMQDLVDVSIVIVNWNVRVLLDACLSSVYADKRNLRIEIFVIDNASTDDSVQWIRQHHPQVHLIVNSWNQGFPKANNRGITCSSGRYILLLNPDTIIYPGALVGMFAYLESHPEVGAVGPRIMTPNGNIQFEGGREFPTLFNMFGELSGLSRIFPKSSIFNRWKMGYWNHLDIRAVPCLLGACMFLRRDALASIGHALDETLPMYFEDVDLCYRLYQSGWSIHYLGAITILHQVGQSAKVAQHKSVLDYFVISSLGLFFERHKGKPESYIFRFMVLLLGGVKHSLLMIAALLSLPESRHLPQYIRRYKIWISYGLGKPFDPDIADLT